MKNLFFVFCLTFSVSALLHCTKVVESDSEENEIELEYENDDSSNKSNNKNIYPNLNDIKNKTESELNLKKEENKDQDEKQPHTTSNYQVSILPFSITMNALLGILTQCLDISFTQAFLLGYMANWGLSSWYQHRIKNNSALFKYTFITKWGLVGTLRQNHWSSQQDVKQEKKTHTLQIELMPYCQKTHYCAAFVSETLSSALTKKAGELTRFIFGYNKQQTPRRV